MSNNDPADSHPSEHLEGLKVTENLLPMLGVEPLLGRLFLKGEDREGANHEAILSYALWQRRFGGDRNVLGKLIRLDGEAYSIVGVMPRGFKFAPFWGRTPRFGRRTRSRRRCISEEGIICGFLPD